MKLMAHGSYDIKIEDNILIVNARGPFNELLVQQFDRDIKGSIEHFKGKVWGSLVTYYGNGIFTPEAEEELVSITRYRVKHGMIVNASVFLESQHADLQQMQLRRVYQSCNVTFHSFSDSDSAKQWLQRYLEQRAAI